jgi:hypothetical protein
MEMILDELGSGLPDTQQFTRVVIRMLAAALLGAMVGIQRERAGKPAGVRTHMLVSMGAALFVVACLEWGMGSDAMSRVIQGLVTGIGFLSAKDAPERRAAQLPERGVVKELDHVGGLHHEYVRMAKRSAQVLRERGRNLASDPFGCVNGLRCGPPI